MTKSEAVTEFLGTSDNDKDDSQNFLGTLQNTTEKDAPPSESFLGTLQDTGWRDEINKAKSGVLYWSWRRGSHAKRESAKGGKFIPERYGDGFTERLNAYRVNAKEQARRRKAKKQSAEKRMDFTTGEGNSGTNSNQRTESGTTIQPIQ